MQKSVCSCERRHWTCVVSTSENLAVYPIGRNIAVVSGERLEIPISIKIPEYTPKSSKKSPVWAYTGADIPNALDPADRDNLDILEHDHIKKFLLVIEKMGFRLRELEVERDLRRSEKFYSDIRLIEVDPRVVQEYEWSPSNEYKGNLDEIEALLYSSVADIGAHTYERIAAEGDF